MRLLITSLAVTGAIGGAHSAVTVTDNGTIAPTLGGANDTGYTGTPNNRFGWDYETLTQSFTVASAGTIQSIFFGYNGFDDGKTITIDLSVNGVNVATDLVLDGNNFSGDSGTDGNNSPFYWMEFDLSTENVAVTAGSNEFTMAATANTGGGWALAPTYNLGGNPYADGELSLKEGIAANSDLRFGVTTAVPEPSAAALLGLGGLALILRRRK